MPFEGLVIVTPASAGIVRITSKRQRRERSLRMFMDTTEERVFKNLP
jgi:hypothetical protein